MHSTYKRQVKKTIDNLLDKFVQMDKGRMWNEDGNKHHQSSNEKNGF